MAKKTKAEILTTIADMDAAGEKISVRAVLARLGAGSMSDIAPIVKEYNSTRSLDTAPEKVYSTLSNVADQLWADASMLAKESWNSERLDLHSKLEDLQGELNETQSELELKEATIIQQNDQIAELKSSHSADKTNLMKLIESKSLEADRAIKTAEADKSKAESENTKLKAQLEGAKEQISMLKDMLEKFKPEKNPKNT
ncbi:DNA-binding protein [Shewanella chilikensis]|uniref:DNA-binding protein n=1 Tax=Shewanella chilikensis TaxID=558541 RepID=UPI003A975AD3